MVHLRVSTDPPTRPSRPLADGSVCLVLPARDEAERIGSVIDRLPPSVAGRPTWCLVVDDGSNDATAAVAESRGARVVVHPEGRGLGAAVATGLAIAAADGAAIVAFCDADGEYDPAELERLVAPLVDGAADYVVGSRFTGTIAGMRPHRRAGNVALTQLLRFMTRCPITDGQSGYRALSADAARSAEIAHDYNYAQVLTIDLLQQGFRYAEVPISYRWRASGRSFVRLLPYLRHVLPAMIRQLNQPNRIGEHMVGIEC